MSDNDRPSMDEMKGRVKQAAGELTDDDELKDEGEVEETAGKVKKRIGDFADSVKEKIDDTVDRLTD